LTIWGLSEDDVAGEPHISEIVERLAPFSMMAATERQ